MDYSLPGFSIRGKKQEYWSRLLFPSPGIFLTQGYRRVEKEMADHSSILAWRIPMDRGAWQITVHGVTGVGHDLATKPLATKYHREV